MSPFEKARATVNGGESRSTRPSRQEARTLLKKIVDLPTLPAVVQKVIEVVEDERSSATDLARVIMTDESLTARVLRLANSAFYGHHRGVSSVTQAMVVLGFDVVKSLVLGISIFNTLWGKGKKVSAERKKMWLHSVTTASASNVIISATKPEKRETAFVAGLLHDIGKVALLSVYPQEYQDICRSAGNKRCPIQEVEASVLGFDHAEVGGWLSEQWNLPPEIVNAIMYHHRPGASPADSRLLTSVVHVGDLLATGTEQGDSDWILLVDPTAKATLGVTDADLLHYAHEPSIRGDHLKDFMAR